MNKIILMVGALLFATSTPAKDNAYLFTENTQTEGQATPQDVTWNIDQKSGLIYVVKSDEFTTIPFVRKEVVTGLDTEFNKYILESGGALYVDRNTNDVILCKGDKQYFYKHISK